LDFQCCAAFNFFIFLALQARGACHYERAIIQIAPFPVSLERAAVIESAVGKI